MFCGQLVPNPFRSAPTCWFLLATPGSFPTSAGLKYDRLRAIGEVGGVLPLEKLDVDVAEPLDARLSMLLELSSSRVLGASWVSARSTEQ